MKATYRALLIAALGLAGQQAFAANVSANFNASVTLTSVCQIKAGSDNQTLDFGTYTAFGASKTAAPINIEFDCTRGFAAAPTVAFDASGTDKTTSVAGTTATGAGVVAGLQYSVAVAAAVKTTGITATAATPGTADSYKYAVSGTMAAGQAGTDGSGVKTQARQLIITY